MESYAVARVHVSHIRNPGQVARNLLHDGFDSALTNPSPPEMLPFTWLMLAFVSSDAASSTTLGCSGSTWDQLVTWLNRKVATFATIHMSPRA